MKLLPSTNLTTPRILIGSQATTKGIYAPIPYGRSYGAKNLTLHDSITRQMVLQGNPMPLTPGIQSSTGPSEN